MCGRRGWPACVRPLGDSLIDIRDRAVLLIGYAGAFRRSELVGLDVEDIAEVEDGLRITLAPSKADQEGEGIVIGIPYGSNPVTCPVRAWRAWLLASGITGGAAFRSITGHGTALKPGDSATAPSPRWSSAAPATPSSSRACSGGTRCGRASRPRGSPTGCRSSGSCRTGGGSAAHRCGGTSAKASCSGTAPRRSWGSDRRRFARRRWSTPCCGRCTLLCP